MYYINYIDSSSVRLSTSLEEDTEIVQVKLINKDFQSYSLRKIDYDNLRLEDVSPEIKENTYFLLTAHKNGKVKVWSIPEYEIVMKFDVLTEVYY